MSLYSVETVDGFTRYSTKLEDLPIFSGFADLSTLTDYSDKQ